MIQIKKFKYRRIIICEYSEVRERMKRANAIALILVFANILKLIHP